ncbi:MAG TPA: alpha/beta fold hydrolase [Streptosporangiaceae bacterium]|nr:alpha/beta fold hydrolase [Streptosporangiaceae bacterium]
MTSFRHPGTVLTDHFFTVPLDHDDPGGPQIEVFAREVTSASAARANFRDGANLPWLLFLQGGPGGASPRPVGRWSWLDRALKDYRVLLLDQRGTGRSTPATRQTLAGLGGPREQAGYLANFRADSIVRDAEIIRRALIGDEPWSILGQSYGGFCSATYLSLAPEGLREALITGGLPGLEASAEDVYRATYPRVAAKVAAHYERYPDDIDHAKRIARHLRDHDVRRPDGGRLTVEAFQSTGHLLGMSTGSHELHYMLEDAFAGDDLSDTFLRQVQTTISPVGPLYVLLHEACYAQGEGATRWAAQRVRAEFPEFAAAAALDGDAPLMFTGEMIYPWTVADDPLLRPLRETAEVLAERTDWPRLYDPARLAASEVPAAAAVYFNDMYVDAGFSLATARASRGLQPWVTSEYEHDGLRVSHGAVLDRLIRMVRGEAG